MRVLSSRRLAIGQGDAHAFPDRPRVFARERENISQEGFDALIHRAFRPGSLRALPRVFRQARGRGSKPSLPYPTNGCFWPAMD
jgi:hypothetical protein